MTYMKLLTLQRIWTTINQSIGTDIVSVQRIRQLLEQHGDRFKQKTFTPNEVIFCDGKPNPSTHFAGRFAAKEAIKKCIYSSGYKKEIPFNKIEILPDSNGIPLVSNIDKLTYEKINVSISHESEFAVAVAIFFYKWDFLQKSKLII